MIHLLKEKSKLVNPPKKRKTYELNGTLDDFLKVQSEYKEA